RSWKNQGWAAMNGTNACSTMPSSRAPPRSASSPCIRCGGPAGSAVRAGAGSLDEVVMSATLRIAPCRHIDHRGSRASTDRWSGERWRVVVRGGDNRVVPRQSGSGRGPAPASAGPADASVLWIGLSVAALSLVLVIGLGIGGDLPPLLRDRAEPEPLRVVAPIVVLLVLRVCMELVYQRAHQGSRPATVLYLVHGLTLLVGVTLNPFLCIYAFLGFLDVERFLPRRVVVGGIIGTALLCAFGQAGAVAGVMTSPLVFMTLLLVNFGLASAMTWFVRLREEHADERERVAAELAEAHRENLALHEQLLEQARSAGVAQERARLSRAIHDTVAQGLVGVIRQLETLPDDLGQDARPGIERAEHAARDCLSEARRAVRALAPHQLAEDDLTGALRGLLERWTASQATPAELV